MESVEYVIKFEGLTAGEHAMDLGALGESLQGFSKILGVAGDFASHGRYTRKYSGLGVRVVTDGKFAAGSLEVTATVIGILPELFSGLAEAVVTAVVSYVISKRSEEDMSRLSDSLNQAISQATALKEALAKQVAEQDAKNVQLLQQQNALLMQQQKALLDVVKTMSVSLGAAAREALSPVGKYCSSVSLHTEGKCVAQIDPAMKAAIEERKQEVTQLGSFSGVLTAIDRDSGSCKVAPVEDDGTRSAGVIWDTTLQDANNPYFMPLITGSPLSFKAKAVLNKDGEPVKFYITEAQLAG